MRLPHSHLGTLTLNVDMRQIVPIGATPAGHRSIAPVQGGSFSGGRLQATVLPGGNDWVITRPDGSMAIDVRLTLLTPDGAHIYLGYQGTLRLTPEAAQKMRRMEQISDANIALKTVLKFETGDARYSWLNDVLAVSIGTQSPAGPVYEVFEIG